MASAEYPFEDIRDFLIKRQFLIGYEGFTAANGNPVEPYDGLLTREDFELLKARALMLRPEQAAYLRAFADGWRARG